MRDGKEINKNGNIKRTSAASALAANSSHQNTPEKGSQRSQSQAAGQKQVGNITRQVITSIDELSDVRMSNDQKRKLISKGMKLPERVKKGGSGNPLRERTVSCSGNSVSPGRGGGASPPSKN